jgi:hypothetical protein
MKVKAKAVAKPPVKAKAKAPKSVPVKKKPVSAPTKKSAKKR